MERFMWNIMATIVLAMSPATFAEDLKQPPLTLGEISALIRTSPPFEIRATRTYSTNVSAAELERRWQAVVNKPDHPERGEIERLLDLSRSVETSEMVMAFGGGLWYLERRKGERDIFVAAGDSSRRWMLSETAFEPGKKSGQLTVIRAGIPFPLSTNVGMFREITLVQELAVLCNWNIAANVLEMDPSVGSSLSQAYRNPDVERFLITRDAAGTTIETTCVSVSSPVEMLWKAQCRFGDCESNTPWSLPIANSTRVVSRSGLIKFITNVQARPISPIELRAMTELPKIDSSTTRTVSYDDPGKATGPTGVWESTSTGDKLTLSHLNESVDVAMPARESTGWGRWLAVAVISVVGASLVAIWLRRKS